MLSSLKKITVFLAIGGGIILLVLMLSIGQSEREDIDATWNKLKVNDSLYAGDLWVTDSLFTQFHTFRLIRPINENDVNKMSIPEWKKFKLIAQLDTTSEHAKPVMIDYKLIFKQDDMFKKRTAFLGTYIKSDSITGIYKETIYIPLKWHIIKPNMALCDTDFEFNMPPRYTFADSNCYVDARHVRMFQPKIFSTKKH